MPVYHIDWGKDPKTHRCVVRLKTEAFFRGSTYYECKTLKYLKRPSNTYNFITEHLKEELYLDYPHSIPEIKNLHSLPDGIYLLNCHFNMYEETYVFSLEEIENDTDKSNRPIPPV